MHKLSEKELNKLLPKVELIPIGEIKLNPKNPRTISERDFNRLVKSVTDFWQMLFLRPVILDEENMALGGNMRTLAASKAGFQFMPVIHAHNLTHQQRAEFIIKDNIPFGDWNFDELANDWDNALLADWGMKMPTWNKLDDYHESAGASNKEKGNSSPKEKTDTFDVIVKATTELQRQKIITALQSAGYNQDEHFYLM